MKDNSQPAFPSEQGYTEQHGWNQTWCPGMTLRQWYAGMAMQGMLSAWPGDARWAPEKTAAQAFDFADAMLAHEAKEEE